MPDAMIGWRNAVVSGTLTASSEAAGLDVGQLQNQHGSAAYAWQTAAGVTSANVKIDAGAAASWRAFGIFRTNLTSGATLRVRLSSFSDGVDDPTVLPHDTDAGAVLGANTTRVGTTTDPVGGSTAVTYSSSSATSSFVRGTSTFQAIAGQTYRAKIWAKRISGSGTVGNLIRIQNTPVAALNIAGNLTSDWVLHTLTFTRAATELLTVSFLFGMDATTGEVAIYGGSVEPVPSTDTNVLTGLVASGYAQAVHVLSAEASARYARMDIADASNPDGFLNIPLAYAGPVAQPAVGLAYGLRHARDRDEVVVRSRGGQEFVTLRSARRRWGFGFDALTTAEFWDGLAEMERAAADGSNVLLIPFPSAGNVAREAVFGRLALADDATWPAPNDAGLRRFAGTITERL